MRDKIIYLDLDGVILDNSYRLYSIYKKLMINKNRLSNKAYWNLKRIKIPEEEIIMKTVQNPVFISYYIKKKAELIEKQEFLKYDKLIGSAHKSIKKLRKENKIILVTKRNKKNNLFKQLKLLKILNLFDNIIVCKNGSKANLISKDPSFNRKNSLIIGDTEEDIKSGKKLGIKTIAVSSGIRCENYLKKYKPTKILKNISKLIGMKL